MMDHYVSIVNDFPVMDLALKAQREINCIDHRSE